MADNLLPSPAELRQLLRYEPETGKLFWLRRQGVGQGVKMFNTRYAGKEAFSCVNSHGYFHGAIGGKFFQAHRVAWAIYHGEWPEREIDHINHNRTDNRISNLRQADRAVNCRNVGKAARNTSGVTGVRWNKSMSKWVAYIGAGSKAYLGRFDKKEDAIAARRFAEQELGYHANHGR